MAEPFLDPIESISRSLAYKPKPPEQQWRDPDALAYDQTLQVDPQNLAPITAMWAMQSMAPAARGTGAAPMPRAQGMGRMRAGGLPELPRGMPVRGLQSPELTDQLINQLRRSAPELAHYAEMSKVSGTQPIDVFMHSDLPLQYPNQTGLIGRNKIDQTTGVRAPGAGQVFVNANAANPLEALAIELSRLSTTGNNDVRMQAAQKGLNQLPEGQIHDVFMRLPNSPAQMQEEIASRWLGRSALGLDVNRERPEGLKKAWYDLLYFNQPRQTGPSPYQEWLESPEGQAFRDKSGGGGIGSSKGKRSRLPNPPR